MIRLLVAVALLATPPPGPCTAPLSVCERALVEAQIILQGQAAKAVGAAKSETAHVRSDLRGCEAKLAERTPERIGAIVAAKVLTSSAAPGRSSDLLWFAGGTGVGAALVAVLALLFGK